MVDFSCAQGVVPRTPLKQTFRILTYSRYTAISRCILKTRLHFPSDYKFIQGAVAILADLHSDIFELLTNGESPHDKFTEIDNYYTEKIAQLFHRVIEISPEFEHYQKQLNYRHKQAITLEDLHKRDETHGYDEDFTDLDTVFKGFVDIQNVNTQRSSSGLGTLGLNTPCSSSRFDVASLHKNLMYAHGSHVNRVDPKVVFRKKKFSDDYVVEPNVAALYDELARYKTFYHAHMIKQSTPTSITKESPLVVKGCADDEYVAEFNRLVSLIGQKLYKDCTLVMLRTLEFRDDSRSRMSKHVVELLHDLLDDVQKFPCCYTKWIRLITCSQSVPPKTNGVEGVLDTLQCIAEFSETNALGELFDLVIDLAFSIANASPDTNHYIVCLDKFAKFLLPAQFINEDPKLKDSLWVPHFSNEYNTLTNLELFELSFPLLLNFATKIPECPTANFRRASTRIPLLGTHTLHIDIKIKDMIDYKNLYEPSQRDLAFVICLKNFLGACNKDIMFMANGVYLMVFDEGFSLLHIDVTCVLSFEFLFQGGGLICFLNGSRFYTAKEARGSIDKDFEMFIEYNRLVVQLNQFYTATPRFKNELYKNGIVRLTSRSSLISQVGILYTSTFHRLLFLQKQTCVLHKVLLGITTSIEPSDHNNPDWNDHQVLSFVNGCFELLEKCLESMAWLTSGACVITSVGTTTTNTGNKGDVAGLSTVNLISLWRLAAENIYALFCILKTILCNTGNVGKLHLSTLKTCAHCIIGGLKFTSAFPNLHYDDCQQGFHDLYDLDMLSVMINLVTLELLTANRDLVSQVFASVHVEVLSQVLLGIHSVDSDATSTGILNATRMEVVSRLTDYDCLAIFSRRSIGFKATKLSSDTLNNCWWLTISHFFNHEKQALELLAKSYGALETYEPVYQCKHDHLEDMMDLLGPTNAPCQECARTLANKWALVGCCYPKTMDECKWKGQMSVELPGLVLARQLLEHGVLFLCADAASLCKNVNFMLLENVLQNVTIKQHNDTSDDRFGEWRRNLLFSSRDKDKLKFMHGKNHSEMTLRDEVNILELVLFEMTQYMDFTIALVVDLIESGHMLDRWDVRLHNYISSLALVPVLSYLVELFSSSISQRGHCVVISKLLISSINIMPTLLNITNRVSYFLKDYALEHGAFVPLVNFIALKFHAIVGLLGELITIIFKHSKPYVMRHAMYWDVEGEENIHLQKVKATKDPPKFPRCMYSNVNYAVDREVEFFNSVLRLVTFLSARQNQQECSSNILEFACHVPTDANKLIDGSVAADYEIHEWTNSLFKLDMNAITRLGPNYSCIHPSLHEVQCGVAALFIHLMDCDQDNVSLPVHYSSQVCLLLLKKLQHYTSRMEVVSGTAPDASIGNLTHSNTNENYIELRRLYGKDILQRCKWLVKHSKRGLYKGAMEKGHYQEIESFLLEGQTRRICNAELESEKVSNFVKCALLNTMLMLVSPFLNVAYTDSTSGSNNLSLLQISSIADGDAYCHLAAPFSLKRVLRVFWYSIIRTLRALVLHVTVCKAQETYYSAHVAQAQSRLLQIVVEWFLKCGICNMPASSYSFPNVYPWVRISFSFFVLLYNLGIEPLNNVRIASCVFSSLIQLATPLPLDHASSFRYGPFLFSTSKDRGLLLDRVVLVRVSSRASARASSVVSSVFSTLWSQGFSCLDLVSGDDVFLPSASIWARFRNVHVETKGRTDDGVDKGDASEIQDLPPLKFKPIWAWSDGDGKPTSDASWFLFSVSASSNDSNGSTGYNGLYNTVVSLTSDDYDYKTLKSQPGDANASTMDEKTMFAYYKSDVSMYVLTNTSLCNATGAFVDLEAAPYDSDASACVEVSLGRLQVQITLAHPDICNRHMPSIDLINCLGGALELKIHPFASKGYYKNDNNGNGEASLWTVARGIMPNSDLIRLRRHLHWLLGHALRISFSTGQTIDLIESNLDVCCVVARLMVRYLKGVAKDFNFRSAGNSKLIDCTPASNVKNERRSTGLDAIGTVNSAFKSRNSRTWYAYCTCANNQGNLSVNAGVKDETMDGTGSITMALVSKDIELRYTPFDPTLRHTPSPVTIESLCSACNNAQIYRADIEHYWALVLQLLSDEIDNTDCHHMVLYIFNHLLTSFSLAEDHMDCILSLPTLGPVFCRVFLSCIRKLGQRHPKGWLVDIEPDDGRDAIAELHGMFLYRLLPPLHPAPVESLVAVARETFQNLFACNTANCSTKASGVCKVVDPSDDPFVTLPHSDLFIAHAASRDFQVDMDGNSLRVRRASNLGGIALFRIPNAIGASEMQGTVNFHMLEPGRFGLTVAPADCVFGSVVDLFDRNDVVGFRTATSMPFVHDVFAASITYVVGDVLSASFAVEQQDDGQYCLRTELLIAGNSIGSVLEVVYDPQTQNEPTRRMSLVFIFQDPQTLVYNLPSGTSSPRVERLVSRDTSLSSYRCETNAPEVSNGNNANIGIGENGVSIASNPAVGDENGNDFDAGALADGLDARAAADFVDDHSNVAGDDEYYLDTALDWDPTYDEDLDDESADMSYDVAEDFNGAICSAATHDNVIYGWNFSDNESVASDAMEVDAPEDHRDMGQSDEDEDQDQEFEYDSDYSNVLVLQSEFWAKLNRRKQHLRNLDKDFEMFTSSVQLYQAIMTSGLDTLTGLCDEIVNQACLSFTNLCQEWMQERLLGCFSWLAVFCCDVDVNAWKDKLKEALSRGKATSIGSASAISGSCGVYALPWLYGSSTAVHSCLHRLSSIQCLRLITHFAQVLNLERVTKALECACSKRVASGYNNCKSLDKILLVAFSSRCLLACTLACKAMVENGFELLVKEKDADEYAREAINMLCNLCLRLLELDADPFQFVNAHEVSCWAGLIGIDVDFGKYPHKNRRCFPDYDVYDEIQQHQVWEILHKKLFNSGGLPNNVYIRHSGARPLEALPPNIYMFATCDHTFHSACRIPNLRRHIYRRTMTGKSSEQDIYDCLCALVSLCPSYFGQALLRPQQRPRILNLFRKSVQTMHICYDANAPDYYNYVNLGGHGQTSKNLETYSRAVDPLFGWLLVLLTKSNNDGTLDELITIYNVEVTNAVLLALQNRRHYDLLHGLFWILDNLLRHPLCPHKVRVRIATPSTLQLLYSLFINATALPCKLALVAVRLSHWILPLCKASFLKEMMLAVRFCGSSAYARVIAVSSFYEGNDLDAFTNLNVKRHDHATRIATAWLVHFFASTCALLLQFSEPLVTVCARPPDEFYNMAHMLAICANSASNGICSKGIKYTHSYIHQTLNIPQELRLDVGMARYSENHKCIQNNAMLIESPGAGFISLDFENIASATVNTRVRISLDSQYNFVVTEARIGPPVTIFVESGNIQMLENFCASNVARSVCISAFAVAKSPRKKAGDLDAIIHQGAASNTSLDTVAADAQNPMDAFSQNNIKLRIGVVVSGDIGSLKRSVPGVDILDNLIYVDFSDVNKVNLTFTTSHVTWNFDKLFAFEGRGIVVLHPFIMLIHDVPGYHCGITVHNQTLQIPLDRFFVSIPTTPVPRWKLSDGQLVLDVRFAGGRSLADNNKQFIKELLLNSMDIGTARKKKATTNSSFPKEDPEHHQTVLPNLSAEPALPFEFHVQIGHNEGYLKLDAYNYCIEWHPNGAVFLPRLPPILVTRGHKAKLCLNGFSYTKDDVIGMRFIPSEALLLFICNDRVVMHVDFCVFYRNIAFLGAETLEADLTSAQEARLKILDAIIEYDIATLRKVLKKALHQGMDVPGILQTSGSSSLCKNNSSCGDFALQNYLPSGVGRSLNDRKSSDWDLGILQLPRGDPFTTSSRTKTTNAGTGNVWYLEHSCIYVASILGRVFALEIFAKLGVDFNVVSGRFCETPLFGAIKHGQLHAATLLLCPYGANVESVDINGTSVLMYILTNPPKRIAVLARCVELLLHFGAKVHESMFGVLSNDTISKMLQTHYRIQCNYGLYRIPWPGLLADSRLCIGGIVDYECPRLCKFQLDDECQSNLGFEMVPLNGDDPLTAQQTFFCECLVERIHAALVRRLESRIDLDHIPEVDISIGTNAFADIISVFDSLVKLAKLYRNWFSNNFFYRLVKILLDFCKSPPIGGVLLLTRLVCLERNLVDHEILRAPKMSIEDYCSLFSEGRLFYVAQTYTHTRALVASPSPRLTRIIKYDYKDDYGVFGFTSPVNANIEDDADDELLAMSADSQSINVVSGVYWFDRVRLDLNTNFNHDYAVYCISDLLNCNHVQVLATMVLSCSTAHQVQTFLPSQDSAIWTGLSATIDDLLDSLVAIRNMVRDRLHILQWPQMLGPWQIYHLVEVLYSLVEFNKPKMGAREALIYAIEKLNLDISSDDIIGVASMALATSALVADVDTGNINITATTTGTRITFNGDDIQRVVQNGSGIEGTTTSALPPSGNVNESQDVPLAGVSNRFPTREVLGTHHILTIANFSRMDSMIAPSTNRSNTATSFKNCLEAALVYILIHDRLELLNSLNQVYKLTVPIVSTILNQPLIEYQPIDVIEFPSSKSFFTCDGDNNTAARRQEMAPFLGPPQQPYRWSCYMRPRPFIKRIHINELYSRLFAVLQTQAGTRPYFSVRVDRGIAVTANNIKHTLWHQVTSQLLGCNPNILRSKSNQRPFMVVFKGEGATDFGGPFQELLTCISSEAMEPVSHGSRLQRRGHVACLATPNSKNAHGSYQDSLLLKFGLPIPPLAFLGDTDTFKKSKLILKCTDGGLCCSFGCCSLFSHQHIFPGPAKGCDFKSPCTCGGSEGYSEVCNQPLPLELAMYEALGRIFAMCVCMMNPLNLSLNPLIWKKLLLVPDLGLADLADADKLSADLLYRLEQVYSKTLTREYSLDMLEDLPFTIESTEGFLCNILLDENTKISSYGLLGRYLALVSLFKFTQGDLGCTWLARGYNAVLPIGRFRMLLCPNSFEYMICGDPIIDLEVLRAHTASSSLTLKRDLFDVLAKFDNDMLQMFLRFTSGRSRLPPSQLEWSFNVEYDNQNQSNADERLPTSATCNFRLLVPRYSTKGIFYKRLVYAIKHCIAIDLDAYTIHDEMQINQS